MTRYIHCSSRFRDLSPLSSPAADGRAWIHIVPASGEYPGAVEIPAGYDIPGHGVIDEDLEVDGLTIITSEKLAEMVERFEPEMLVDYEHHSHDPDKRTDAAGWGHALRKAADGRGLELQTEWAKPARQEIEDRVYRFISPEFAGSVRFEAGTFKFFPTRLTGAGLTNRPKLRVLRPVSINSHRGPNGPQAASKVSEGQISSLVATVKNRERCTFLEAWEIAKGEKPELFNLERPAATVFQALVAKVKSRDRCGFRDAWNTAKVENPAAFRALEEEGD